MRSTPTRLVALGLMIGFAATGCGDDGPSMPTESSGGGVPSTGVEAAPPSEATTCLESAGFTVTAAPQPADGIEAQLTIATAGGGTGSITYYVTEEEAFAANKEASEDQGSSGDPSVIGRTGKALYVYAGSDIDARVREILGCL